MRLLGIKNREVSFFYLIIYQAFKSLFSIENETLRLFSSKKTFSRKKAFALTGRVGLTSENAYPLDSIKEGTDEPVANDTCDVTDESNPGDVLHIPAEGNLLQAHYYHTSGTTDNQH